MCCPSPHHRETDSVEGLRQVQDQGQSPLIFFLCFAIQSFHPNFPHRLLGSSVSAICRILWCSHGFPPTNQRRHERNWSLTHDILWNQEKYRRACLLRAIFHSTCSTFSKNSTVSPNVSCVTFRRTFWAEAIRTYFCFCLIQSRYFSNSPTFSLGKASSNFFNSSFFQGFVLHVLHAFVALPMLCPCTSPPCCWLTDLVQEPSASLRNLNHLRHFLLMHFLHLFSSSFFFISSIHLYHFCMVSSHPGWIHAFSQSAANKSVTHHRFSALTLHVDLIFFVKSFINFILCCCFISSSLVTPYVCFVNAGGSALSLPILFLYFLFLRTRLHYSGARASASICPPNSSSIDRSLPDSNFSILSFLLCLFQHDCLPCLSFLQ